MLLGGDQRHPHVIGDARDVDDVAHRLRQGNADVSLAGPFRFQGPAGAGFELASWKYGVNAAALVAPLPEVKLS